MSYIEQWSNTNWIIRVISQMWARQRRGLHIWTLSEEILLVFMNWQSVIWQPAWLACTLVRDWKAVKKTKAQNSRQPQVPMPWFPFQLATFPLLKQTCTSASLCKFFCVINITVSHGVCTFTWNGHHIEMQYLLVFSWSSSLLFLRVH